MGRRTLGIVLGIAFTLLGFGQNLFAQANPTCLQTVGWASSLFQGNPVTPPWFVVANPGCLFCITYGAYLATCPPSNASNEVCNTCTPSGGGSGSGGSGSSGSGSGGSGPGSGGSAPGGSSSPVAQAGAPISLPSGNTFISETDVRVPGLGGGLKLTRRWNSVWPATQIASSIGIFGPNWRSTYEERVFMGSDNYLKYSRSDGSYWSFGLGPGNTTVLAAPANTSASFSAGSANWTITFLNGEQRQFSPSTGLLTAIIDRNGNTTQLAYDSSNRLITVTSPASQHLYFNYPSGSFLVSSVTSDFGVTLSYSYDAQGRLSKVTEPDQTTITFAYNAQSQITSVTDSNGKVLESHTYDTNGRGLTSARANGVESVTVTYP